MTRGEVLARVMDEASRRVLSGTERPYQVAIETSAQLVHLYLENDSDASWSAQILWEEISDMLDAPGGPESEELCDELALEFSRKWMELANREDESVQRAFMAAFDVAFDERLSEYRATH